MLHKDKRLRRVLLFGTAALAGATGTVILYLVDPQVSVFFPPCPFLRLTGLYCAGCGALRATHALLHGRLAAAFAYNPLLVASLPALAALVVRPAWARRPDVARIAAATLLAYWLLRNLPVWPLTLLAPH